MNTFIDRGGMRRGRASSGCAGCLMPIIGLIFLLVGIYLLRDTLAFLPGTVTAQGVIVRCVDDSSNDSGNDSGDDYVDAAACSPTVRFTAQSGKAITFDSSFSSSSFAQGQDVQVKYHPANPQDARIDSFFATWLLPLVSGGVGILLLILSPFLFLRGLLRGLLAPIFFRPRF